jgi:adenylosuccinate synthase
VLRNNLNIFLLLLSIFKNFIKKYTNQMIVDIILGCSYGDEGKGKVVHCLTEKNKYDLSVRFNGSCNAGHTVYIDNKKFILHQLPVGILSDHGYTLISSDCLVDMSKLEKELNEIREKGINTVGRLFISGAAHIITQDAIDYDRANNLIGTTGSGIGPTYANKMLRKGKRVYDFQTEFEQMGFQIVDMTKFWFSDFVKNNVSSLLLEGAQGFGLDINWTNNYPYCTSSTCTLAGAINTGIQLKDIRNIYGIAKAYDTYVGLSKFQPDDDNNLVIIGDHGKEYGSTTGRRRQCNYLNLENLKNALYINNCNVCIINKVDILKDINIFKVIGQNNEVIPFETWDEMKQYIIDYYPNVEYVFSESPNSI